MFAPAIKLAREGWTLSPRAHEYLAENPERAGHVPAGKALFYGPDSAPVPVGTLVRNPALATTLERIATEGPAAFYSGSLARRIADAVSNEAPGREPMTVADVAAYRAKERPPVCGRYRLYRICGMGPPSSGATTVLAILGQLERFDLSKLDAKSATFWHLFAESQRLAYADRERFLADADFIAVPTTELIAPAYLAKRGRLIAPDRTMAIAAPGLDQPPPDGMEPPENGTSHFVAIDRNGEVVSYTSTIEGSFGSGLMTGGFYLNNELTDFSFMPDKDGVPVANRVEGGKRPRSSMAPTLVYGPDGGLLLAIGAAGGATIPVQVSRALIGVLDWKLPVSDALALPVLFSPGDTVIVEAGTPLEALIPQLEALGHTQVVARRLPIKTNAVAASAGGLAGAADPRSEGRAIPE